MGTFLFGRDVMIISDSLPRRINDYDDYTICPGWNFVRTDRAELQKTGKSGLPIRAHFEKQLHYLWIEQFPVLFQQIFDHRRSIPGRTIRTIR